jgi:hypothetical protein
MTEPVCPQCGAQNETRCVGGPGEPCYLALTAGQRFRLFTDAELAELWDGLTMDDGIRYGIEPPDIAEADIDNQAAYPAEYVLVCELHAEAEMRGLDDLEPDRWGNVP